MFSKLQLFVSFLVATAVSASTIPSVIPTTSLPKYSLTIGDLAVSRVRPASVANVNVDPAAALVDPTLILCSAANCSAGCFRFLLVGTPQNTCLAANGLHSYLSVFIDNPDFTPIPFGVLVGNCAVSLVQIPQTNTCFNINPAGVHFAVIAGNTH